MTSRADLIETAARTMAAYIDHHGLAHEEATAVLDAVLPQITTTEELEALPFGSVAIDEDGSTWVRSGGWVRTKHIKGFAPASVVVDYGPLTVVWQPS